MTDERSSWPPEGNRSLDGFTYRRISPPKDTKSRLEWLDLQKSFSTQPYLQLAKTLREEGYDARARQVLYEMENRKYQHTDRDWHWWLARICGSVLRLTIGYGIHPMRAVWWLLALVGLRWVLYGIGCSAGAMAPTNKEAYQEFHRNHQLPEYYQHFHAPIYS